MEISHHQDRAGQSLKAAPSGGTDRSEVMIASSGVTFQLWRLYQHAWLNKRDGCDYTSLIPLLRHTTLETAEVLALPEKLPNSVLG